MIRLGTAGRTRALHLVENSPLRRVDPRTKLALSLCASLAVMLPLAKLVVFMSLYVLLLLWARLDGLLGALTLRALRRAGFFAYLAEKR